MPKLVLRLQALPTGTLADSAAPRHVVDLGHGGRPVPAPTPTTLARWSRVTATSHDPCLLLDDQGRAVSVSAAAGLLLGCGDGVIGRHLLAILDLVDFDTGASAPDYALRVAPLAVLKDGAGLVRSLLRVRHADGQVHTLDAAAAPLHDADGRLVGSLTHFAALGG